MERRTTQTTAAAIVLLTALASCGVHVSGTGIAGHAFEFTQIPGGPSLAHSPTGPRSGEVLDQRLELHGLHAGSWSMQIKSGARGKATFDFRDEPTPEQLTEVAAALEVSGNFELLLVAQPEDLDGTGASLDEERARISAWTAIPNHHLRAYNATAYEDGGSASLLWFREPNATGDAEPGLVPCLRPELLAPAWHFSSTDIQRASPTDDELGDPAVSIELRPTRDAAFAQFTEAYAGHQLAFVLDGRLLSLVTIEQSFRGPLTLRRSGERFSEKEVERIALALQAPLPFAVRYVGWR